MLGDAVPVFPWGDLSARCTRGNGVLDTEDLDGDKVLDAPPGEDVFRYVVDLRAAISSCATVSRTRDTLGRTAVWRLYRVPIREPTNPTGSPTLRLVQHLRITLATPPDAGRPTSSRGSPWPGCASWAPPGPAAPNGRSSACPAPPRSRTARSPSASQHRESHRSRLRVAARHRRRRLPPGRRSGVARHPDQREVAPDHCERSGERRARRGVPPFPRRPAEPADVPDAPGLVPGTGPGWEEGDLQAFIKLGSDDENFYLYRSPARSTTWEPEAVIDLETWRRLRAVAENAGSAARRPPARWNAASDPTAYVACNGPYLVHVRGSRDQSAQSGRGPGDLRRHLSGRASR